VPGQANCHRVLHDLEPGQIVSCSNAFVNQLEMALFSWIKKNPSPRGRPLTGLLVMDEAQNFAPSQKSTPCKESTLALVAQARKYGLGMVFATQVSNQL
jgi:DNA helicase HerA-like ATPase